MRRACFPALPTAPRAPRAAAALLLVGATASLLAACGPPKPARVLVGPEGAQYDGIVYPCQPPLMAVLGKLDRDRQVEIVPASADDNYEALKVEASVEARGFKFVGLTLATGKGAWSSYPPVPPDMQLKTCPSAGPAPSAKP